jgi:LmbE family N-acetylglucosaminyl deacetylase
MGTLLRTGEGQSRQLDSCRQLALVDAFDIDVQVPPDRRAVILATHPNDEILSCGGLLQQLSLRGRTLQLISLTDGPAFASDCASPHGRSLACAMESSASLRRLGIAQVRLKWIRGRFRAGELEGQATALLDFLMRYLRPNDVVFAPWRDDGDADHQAVGRAAQNACAILAARLVETPTHAWHAVSADDPRIPWWRARKLALDIPTQARKRHAISSQTYHLEAHDTNRRPEPRHPMQLHCELFFI